MAYSNGSDRILKIVGENRGVVNMNVNANAVGRVAASEQKQLEKSQRILRQ